MGLNSEHAMHNPIVVDIETCGLANAVDYLEPPQPDKRLKDEAKVAEDIKAKTAEQLAMCSLDWNVGRVAALGIWTEENGFDEFQCINEERESWVLDMFWRASRGKTIVGFNIKAFDLRFLIRRSQLLGIKHPDLDLGKYAKKGIVDLYLDLTFGDGLYDKGAMRRSLKAFCKRFGIPVNDDINGADVPKLVETGDWEKVLAHVRSDVEMTVALARKLGVVRQAVEEAVL